MPQRNNRFQVFAEIEMRDKGSVTGKNIVNLQKKFGKDPRLMTGRQARNQMKTVETPLHPEEEWKMDMLGEMMMDRQWMKEEGKEDDESELLQFYIDTLCTI